MADGSRTRPAFWLRAFGVTGLGRVGEDSSLPLGMKSLAMLVYLAEASPRPVSRDALVELLWERVEPTQGKGSLRQEIRRLKKILGDEGFDALLDVTDNHVAMRVEAAEYDGAAMVRAAESDDPDRIAALMQIADGDFLASNSARAESFQQWAMERREFLKDMTVASLARLGFLDVDAGRFERAQVVADRIAQIDPLHEKGCEIMIRTLLGSGRRGQARAHFERFRALLLRELTTEPDKSLADLVAPGPQTAPKEPPKPEEPKAEAKTERVSDRPVIAVMNVTRRGNDDQAYLADGVAEQLVANLSRSAWIRVAALNMSPYPIADGDIDRSQRDIRDYADYVLRVDVRASRSQVAITATLNRVADNATVFSDRMEDQISDLLALQRKVALRIASIFEPLVLEEEAKREGGIVWDDEPESIDHWRYLMRARWLFWTTTPRNNAEAQRLLTAASKIKPNDAPTLCLMAFTHMLSAWSDWTDDVDGAVAEARRWAQRAVQAAPNDGWAQFTLGVMCSTPDGLDQAKSRVSHGLRLSPSLVVAIGELARLNVFDGDLDEARRLADEALSLSPYDQQSGLWIRAKALASWVEGDLENALELIDYALIIRPGWFQNHYLRAAILIGLDEPEAARAAMETAKEKVGAFSDASLRIGHPFRDEATLKRFAAALNKAGGAFSI
ncbi:MAG: BTAD domain-containing putative transcriptional regulator [Pseudomonadota bacterium]